MLGYLSIKSDDFKEELHPRDDSGKFSEGSGGGKGKLQRKQAAKPQSLKVITDEDRDKIRQKIADDLYADQKGKIIMPTMKEIANKPLENANQIESAITSIIPQIQTDRYSPPTLAEVYDKVAEKTPNLSIDDFKVAIAKMHSEHKLRALTHTRAVSEIERPELAIPAEGEVFNNVEIRR
jgi:hypothetical protein